MKRPENCVIQFGSLPTGVHEFMFEIDDSFFEQFEHSIVQKATADVLVTFEKKDHILLLDFTITGNVTLPCDRCLREMNLEIEGFNELIVKFGDHSEEESEDVIVIPNKAHELNVSQYIYEYITMLIPLRNVHPEDDSGNSLCDPEALKELEKHQVHDETKPADPRWDALKNINPN